MKFFIFLAINFVAITSFATPVGVVVETNRGNIELELYPDKAPLSVQNFLTYVDSKFYNGTIIHRVVKNFVIQAGGMAVDLSEKPANPPIKNEANNGLSNLKGTLAMARTEVIDSADSHFFINLKDNTRLDYKDPDHFGYAVFGKVKSGYDIVQLIETEAVQTVGEYENVPVTPIIILNVRRK